MAKHLGTRYLYGKDAAVGEQAMDADALAGALRSLPEDLLARLLEAAIRTDMNQVEQLIGEVAAENTAAAVELQTLADEFAYARIAELLQATRRPPGCEA
jgi:hypothetical protein